MVTKRLGLQTCFMTSPDLKKIRTPFCVRYSSRGNPEDAGDFANKYCWVFIINNKVSGTYVQYNFHVMVLRLIFN